MEERGERSETPKNLPASFAMTPSIGDNRLFPSAVYLEVSHLIPMKEGQLVVALDVPNLPRESGSAGG